MTNDEKLLKGKCPDHLKLLKDTDLLRILKKMLTNKRKDRPSAEMLCKDRFFKEFVTSQTTKKALTSQITGYHSKEKQWLSSERVDSKFLILSPKRKIE